MSTVVLGLYLAVAGELHQVVKYEKKEFVTPDFRGNQNRAQNEPTSYLVKDAGKKETVR